MKPKFLIIKNEIYPRHVLLTRASAKEIDRFLRRRSVHLTDEEISHLDDGLGRTAKTINPSSGPYIIIQFYDKPCVPVLVHELFHATTMILSDVGVSLCNDSDEAYAYLLHYLVEKAVHFI